MRFGSYLILSSVIFLSACDPGGQQQPAPQGADSSETISEPMAGMGIMIGEVTSTTALAQVRLTQTDKLVDGDVPGAAGYAEFSVYKLAKGETEPAADAEGMVYLIEAVAEWDFIGRVPLTDLSPGTGYLVKTRIGKEEGNLTPGPEARFKTHPGADSAEEVRFVVVTGMNYAKFHGDKRIDRAQHLLENNTNLPSAYTGPDKHLGYPALETILALKPDFFVGTGDNVYYDTPDNPRAETTTELRQKWHEQFIQPRYIDLFAAVPTYWEIDDHDYRIDDGDNTGDHAPSPEEGRRMMLEQLPVVPVINDEAKTYRTHRVSRDLQIWFVENRMYRSPNLSEDGPEKTIWGAQQKEWLKRTLKESDATFKIMISPTPMIGPDDKRKTDNHADIGGFQHERDEFFAFLKEAGLDKRNFYLVCGDRHWQYHALHPSGIEEFSCGALIDANSRPGRKPGDPESTDPEGTIEHLYNQDPPSGGFLEIKVTPGDEEKPATLTFLYRDERGELLYEHTKQGHTKHGHTTQTSDE